MYRWKLKYCREIINVNFKNKISKIMFLEHITMSKEKKKSEKKNVTHSFQASFENRKDFEKITTETKMKCG